MVRIAIGYVMVVVLCAVLILLNPMDFMGREAREARTADAVKAEGAADQSAALVVAPGEPAKGGNQSIATATAAILADLTAAADKSTDDTSAALAAPAEGDEALRKMSEAVLAGLSGEEPAPAKSLEGLVVQALSEGQSDAAIDEIVNQAVAEGDVEAPASLRTAEGKVDTAVLLASILAEAQGDEFGQGDLSDPAEVVDGGTPSLLAATEDVLYVVEPGDSLGSLALRFYGDAQLHDAIFKANRQVMDTPEGLSAGMKLLIPAKTSLE